MSRLFNILAVVLTLCLGWPVLAAPAPATVVADMISIDGQGNLVAQGNIEVFYNGATLQASKIIYDRAAEDLDIIGPLVLVDEQGNRLSADRGMLSRDLQNGILTSARLLLDNQLDLRAQSIARQEGRFSATPGQRCRISARAGSSGAGGVPRGMRRGERTLP